VVKTFAPLERYGEALRRVMSGKNRVKIGPISNKPCLQTGGVGVHAVARCLACTWY